MKNIAEYLKNIFSKDTDEIPDKVAVRLYLLSEIFPHQSYEKLFDKDIDSEKRNLHEQRIYSYAQKKDKKQLMELVEARIKSM